MIKLCENADTLNSEPAKGLHSSTMASIVKMKTIVHVPLAVAPRKNSSTVVKRSDLERITAMLIGIRER